MIKEKKYKAWDGKLMYGPFTLLEGLNDKHKWYAGEYPKDTVFLEYIGLKNKHGREVFEGDVFFSAGQNFYYRQIVTWDPEEGKYILRNIGRYQSTGYPNIELIEKLEHQGRSAGYFGITVALHAIPEGNIYENPELLIQE